MIDEDTEIYRSLDFFIMKLFKVAEEEREKENPNQDRLENMLDALDKLYDALESLECNL